MKMCGLAPGTECNGCRGAGCPFVEEDEDEHGDRGVGRRMSPAEKGVKCGTLVVKHPRMGVLPKDGGPHASKALHDNGIGHSHSDQGTIVLIPRQRRCE